MKKHTKQLAVFAAPLVALSVSDSEAAFDAFLKIDGPDVKGESQASGHEEEIEILSFSWGAANRGASVGHGGSDGAPVLDSLTITKPLDKSSPRLFRHAFVGEEFETVRLIMRKTYEEEDRGETISFFQIELSDVQVIHIRSETPDLRKSGGGDDRPTESLSFSFEKIKVSYSPQGPDGRYLGLGSDRDVEVEVTNRPPVAVD